MTNSVSSPPVSSLAERIAWMHAPVHLSGSRLPWFVRRVMEALLQRIFSHLEQGILTLLELQRQGKLEPWPEKQKRPGWRPKPIYRMKVTASVAQADQAAAAAAPDHPKPKAAMRAACAALADAAEAQAQVQADEWTQPQPEASVAPCAVVRWVGLRDAGAHRVGCGPREAARQVAAGRGWRDRCRYAMVFRDFADRLENCA